MDTADLRKKALFTLMHVSGMPGKEVVTTFAPEDTLIAVGQKVNRFYFVIEGTVGVTSSDGAHALPERQLIDAVGLKEGKKSPKFFIIGAWPYCTSTESKLEYFALTTVKAYVIDSRLLVKKINEHKGLPIIRAMMHDSDVSDMIKRELLRECGVIVTEKMSAAEVDRLLALTDGAMPGGSYERAAASVLMKFILQRNDASDDPSLIIEAPTFPNASTL